MKPRFSNQRNHAFTITEGLVIVVMLSVVAAVVLAVSNSQGDPANQMCVNNLKQIGLASIIWAGDNGDFLPAQISEEKGGASKEAARGNVAPIFQVMSNELSTPKFLVCPADTNRSAAIDFETDFNNSHISYFIAVDTGDIAPTDKFNPKWLLSGDSHLAVAGVQVKSGLVQLPTSELSAWVSKRHFNQGNLGLVDGSVWQTDDKLLSQKLKETSLTTNRLAIP